MEDDTTAGMIPVALAALRQSAGLEGVAVVAGAAGEPLAVTHAVGDAATVLPVVAGVLARGRKQVRFATTQDGRPVLVCLWEPAGLESAGWERARWELAGWERGGLVLWRGPGARGWSAADDVFGQSVAALIRTMLDHGPGEMGLDALTSLPNRPYFLMEAGRHIERMDQDQESGTMLIVDVDRLSQVNERFGPVVGDRLLVRVALLLRAMVRPGDVVGRVGAAEFAIWSSGMDYMTAAERADALGRRRIGIGDSPDELGRQTLSIGIASRKPGTGEDAHTLLRQAHMAAYDVKQAGGDGWRVFHPPA